MPLKVQLINSQQGVLEVNPDPEGLNEFELELKRSEKNDGIFFEFGINLKFFKNARRFIRDVYESEGIEGVITINIFEYKPNQYEFENIYTGLLRLKDYNIDELGVTVNVEQIGYERSFLSQSKRDVTIPTTKTIEVPGKSILKRFEAEPSSADTFQQIANPTFFFPSGGSGQTRSATRYFMIDLGSREFDEINSINENGVNYGISETDPVPFMIVSPDEQGLIDIDLALRNAFRVNGRLTQGTDVDVGAASTHTPPFTIMCYFEHRNKFNAVIEKTQMGSTYDSVASGDFGQDDVIVDFANYSYFSAAKQINEGDKLYVYYQLDMGVNDFNVSGAPATVEYDLSINADVGALSDFYKVDLQLRSQFPASDVQCNYAFEVFDSVIKRLTNNQCSLKSNFLGRTDIGYDLDGKGALIALTNGHKLRQSNEKLFFVNWEDLFESFNAVFCIGWGFETDELGNNFVRVEEKSYFYDKTTVVLSIQSVSELSKSANQKLYYSQVECGYPKFENIDTANAVDEYNTKHRYASSITQADNELKIISAYRTSSYEIESQRRKSLNTEDSKLDDENFMIALIRDGSLRVEVGADYSSVTGIFDPDTTFNLIFRPSQMIKNWAPVLAATILRSQDKSFDFTYGENNYFLEVNGFREDDDILFTNDQALFYPDNIEFDSEYRANERLLVRNNPRGLIVINDWKGSKIVGYVLNASAILEENKGSFTLLRANVNLDELNS